MLKEERTITLDDLEGLVQEVLAELRTTVPAGAAVLALHGDLGAGKTTFTQALGRALGVHEQITSPTFTIMKGYETTDTVFTQLIHMDAYRIEDIGELGPLRFGEILSTPKTLFCIEWAEKISAALPEKVLNLSLAVASETTRTAHISWS